MKMKKNLKSFLALFITVLTIMVIVCMPVFADDESATQAALTDEEQLLNYFEQYLSSLSQLKDNDLEYAINNSIGIVNIMYSSFKDVREQCGEIVKILPPGDEWIPKESEMPDVCEITVEYECEKGKASAVMILKKDLSLTNSIITLNGVEYGLAQLSFKTAEQDSGASWEKYGKAALNTVLGLFTVFVVLIFISVIISQFRHINGISEYFKNRKTKKEAEANVIDNVFAQIEAKETVEADDMELIAVITAAIAAGTRQSTDSFTVKSIKRCR